ncbi:MAG TPA: NAD+ synthase [Candidatus Omnitrophota bacterium]|nr:NAD+ synthase [Candidatus Omnitrophota bacterium]
MLKIALAQMNAVVGDLAGNARVIAGYAARARQAKADLVVFPELALCGYPPEDLLFKKHFVTNTVKALDALVKKMTGIAAIVGFVDTDAAGRIYNAAAFIVDGTLKGVYRKRELPNYGVFDERRYFTPGTDEGIFTLNPSTSLRAGGVTIAVNICEDIWVNKSVYAAQAKRKPAVMINISSSPYEVGKPRVREALLRRRVRETKIPMVYVNMVGGQDELVFDGASMVIAVDGKVAARAKQFGEDLLLTDCTKTAKSVLPLMDENEEIYNALVTGTRDYVRKNGFAKVAVGLSGGIDSALVAIIAVDALGKDNVVGISMPSPFNVKATRADAIRLARNCGIDFKEIPIKAVFASYLKALKGHFNGGSPGTAEENLQARIRGNLLMAFSNKFGWLVLTTGNKSEMAVGYCTLYGDMSGGFAVLKDIFKTRVYELARWRNIRSGESIIPKSVILRAPSAELKPGQTDEQTLGAYADLDRVLSAYVEGHRSVQDIAGTALPLKYVQKTARLVDSNEYKRRQAPPGVKITSRAFGRDWRLPITNHYRE